MLADLDGDWDVDDFDADALIDKGMSNPTHDDGDLNGDGTINVDDLDLMFAQYGLGLAVIG
jgi:hypothetical protein